MGKIGLNITVSGFTGKLLIRWLEASAPLAEVGRSDAFDFPYDDVYTINNLQPVVHIVQLWQSADGVALTQLIKQWEIDATLYNEIASSTYQYLVDRGNTNLSPVVTGTEVWADPANLDTELTDERLDGAAQSELVVHQAGYGNIMDYEYDLKAGGGIILLNGKTFDNGVAWFITYNRIITQQETESSVSVSEITDVEVIATDRDFYVDSTDNLYNKLGIINGAGTTLTISFLDFSLIPNNTRATFNTHRGSQNYLVLQFDASDTIYFNGSLRNVIYLAKGEEIKLWWKDGVGYVVSYSGNDKIRGQIVGDSQDRSTTSGAYLLADEATGVLNKADYPGLYEWLLSLPPGVCIALASWTTNKRKFGIDTVAFTFRVPHLDDMHRRFRTGSELPGVYLADNNKAHTHFTVADGVVNGDGAAVSSVLYTVRSNEFNNSSSYRLKGVATIPTMAPTSESGTGTETTVKAFKEIPLIIL